MGCGEDGGEDSRNQMAPWASSPNHCYITDKFFWLWKSNVLEPVSRLPGYLRGFKQDPWPKRWAGRG